MRVPPPFLTKETKSVLTASGHLGAGFWEMSLQVWRMTSVLEKSGCQSLAAGSRAGGQVETETSKRPVGSRRPRRSLVLSFQLWLEKPSRMRTRILGAGVVVGAGG